MMPDTEYGNVIENRNKYIAMKVMEWDTFINCADVQYNPSDKWWYCREPDIENIWHPFRPTLRHDDIYRVEEKIKQLDLHTQYVNNLIEITVGKPRSEKSSITEDEWYWVVHSTPLNKCEAIIAAHWRDTP